MTTEQFDIFISHNSRDKQLIDPIVQRLYDEYDIRSWLDKWDLHASAEWEPAIREALDLSRICAVVLGANGWGPYHLKEARFALAKHADDPEYRVIPVLLPGADQTAMQELGDFFQRTHRVDFSNGVADEEAFLRLLSAIRGEAPGPPPLTVFTINRAARQWEQAALADRPSILYRGGELRSAQTIAGTHAEMLSNAAVKFLAKSAEEEQHNVQAEKKRTRKIITSLVAGLIIVAATAVFAFAQRTLAVKSANLAEQRRQEAETQKGIAEEQKDIAEKKQIEAELQKCIADEERGRADVKTKEALAAAEAERIARVEEKRQRGIALVQRDTARSRELASTAVAQLPVDPERSVLLAHAAINTTPTRQAEDALRASLVASHVRSAFRSDMDVANAAAFGPDGLVVLTEHLDWTLAVQNLPTKSTVDLPDHTGRLWRGYFSSGASLMVTFDVDGRTRVWNVKTGKFENELKHSDIIKEVAVSEQSSRIATLSEAELTVWQLPGAAEVLRIKRDAGPLTNGRVSFSPDGQTLRVVGQDNVIKSWDLNTRRPRQIPCTLGGRIETFAFNRDGSRMVVAGNGDKAQVCDTSTGTTISVLNGEQDYFGQLRFSPDGIRVASAGADSAARIWETSTGRLLRELRGHTYAVSDLIFSPDSRYLATISGDKSAMVWDVESGELMSPLLGHDKSVSSAAFSPDGKSLLTLSEDGTARIWEVNATQTAVPLRGHTGNVITATYSPDGQRLLTSGDDKKAVLWNPQTRSVIAELKGHDETVVRTAFSPDGKLLATVAGRIVRVWNGETGSFITEMTRHQWPINSIAFNRDGTMIVTAADIEDTAFVWEARTGRVVSTLNGSGGGSCAPHTGTIADAAFGPGPLVVTASFDNSARIWNGETGACLKVLSGHDRSVLAARFNPSGTRVATASFDNTARIWDVATGQQLKVLDKHTSAVTKVVFNREGTLIATGGDDHKAFVWDAETFQPLAMMKGHGLEVLSVAFSADSRFLITASKDGTARVWEARTGATAAELAGVGQRDWVWTASFSPDGRFAVTASKDGTARIYPMEMFLPLADLQRLADARVTRPLSPAEVETFAPFLPVHQSQPDWRLKAMQR